MVPLCLASTLYHAPLMRRAKRVLLVCDHPRRITPPLTRTVSPLVRFECLARRRQ
jgi:hypothetical protein